MSKEQQNATREPSSAQAGDDSELAVLSRKVATLEKLLAERYEAKLTPDAPVELKFIPPDNRKLMDEQLKERLAGQASREKAMTDALEAGQHKFRVAIFSGEGQNNQCAQLEAAARANPAKDAWELGVRPLNPWLCVGADGADVDAARFVASQKYQRYMGIHTMGNAKTVAASVKSFDEFRQQVREAATADVAVPGSGLFVGV